MKGNLSAYGLDETTTLIHNMEDLHRIQEDDIVLIESSIDNFLVENKEVLQIEGLLKLEESKYHLTESDISSLRMCLAEEADMTPGTESIVEAWIAGIQTFDVHQFLLPMENQLKRMAENMGKPARLSIKGDNARVGIHFKIFAKHLPNLLRNCLYHGIEDIEDRRDKDWPPVIEIQISDYGQEIELQLIDDGRGIDPELIKERATMRSSINKEDLLNLSDQEALQLIFEDGFTTIDEVNEIAGRGAGTSAVRADILKMDGSIHVSSVLNQGTTISVRIPKVLNLSDNDIKKII
jgi:chemotaxis protein histidine kinase CheA